ncbi:MAG: hypothetical protein NC548_46415 [Lachnospiraceae bacterium]|nr:hypothetical protein [Lachnospiraceae bacterium]
MKIARSEQEVHICFYADEDTATIYTSYPAWMRKMDKLMEKSPQYFRCVREDCVSKTYTLPKKFISIRSKERVMTLTEAQKKEAVRRLNKKS